MQKLIKKVIAGAVAALMITSAMPFTALAAPGDYAPDVQLQFSTFGNGEDDFGSLDTGKMKMNVAKTAWTSSVLNSAPIDYDEATGTLTCTKENMNIMNEFYERENAEEDWNLGVGDAFACTIRIDNVNEIGAGNINIRFSDNITPAVYSTTGTSSAAYGHVTTQDELPAKATIQAGEDGAPLEDFSASTLYAGVNDALPDQSAIIDDPYAEDGDGWSDQMMNANIVCQGDSVDVSALADSNAFFDIENGVYDDETGYDYAGKFIVVSFAFMITDEGPIQFALQDPQGEHDPLLDGAAYFAKKSEGLKTEDATTYAINTFDRETMSQGGATEWPGSAKMTFMGKNENAGPVDPGTTKYTVTFLDKDGAQISSTEYDEGADVTIPALPANTYDDNNHYTYAWNAEPSATATADATYQVVETATAHTYDEGVVDPDSTCTATGTKTYTCTGCDKNYTEVVEMKAHTPGEAARENEVPATCSSEGSYDEVVRCTVCNTIISSTPKTIAKLAHTPGEAARENEVPATCTSEGSYDEVVRCTVCNTIISSTPKTIAKLAHTPGEAARENEVPATCSSEGSYDEVVRCTVCNTIISSTPKTIAKLAHTPAAAVIENEVAPTKKDKGSYDEVVYCSECNAEISREKKYTDALGVTITLAKSDIGAVEGDLKVGANKLAYGQAFTVEAKPVDGATFVGWEIGGNIVSKNITYTSTAASDVTITPVFEDAAANNITVTFYDKYGNTVKQYKDKTVAEYQAEIAADFDNIIAPTYPSYTFESWDKSKDEILAIDASTTIWATYKEVEKTEVPKYTVTTNADVILPDGIVNGEIPYDTQAIVRDTAAKAWKVGETIVAYGPEYTFYVGSDVTVDPVYDTVEEKASTTVVGANLVNGSNYKFNIVATRNVPDGYAVIDYGFVYGKNLTDADLDLDNVGKKGSNDNSGDVKAVHAGTRNLETNEFAFNYGIKNMNAPITAKSFVTVVKGGETEIVYSDMFVQNY